MSVERFSIHDVATFKEGSPDDIKAIEDYFSGFAVPSACPGCEKQAPKDMFRSLLGIGDCYRIEWGIVHGHANCTCGWPFVVHHFVKAKDGEELITLRNYALPVHPDFVTKREAAAKGAGE